jgi:PadR family transcriptional regulator
MRTRLSSEGSFYSPVSAIVRPRLTKRIYLLITAGMRRKPGTLLQLESAICVTAAALLRGGAHEFHGYEMARRLGDAADRRRLTAYGTLYRALSRLEQMGLLRSRWEDPEIPARENRPGRRLYSLTAAGEAAARDAQKLVAKRMRRPRRRLVPA